MKKVLTIAVLLSLTAISCSKKESTYEKDSNIMIQEPSQDVVQESVADAPVMADSATIASPAMDSTATN